MFVMDVCAGNDARMSVSWEQTTVGLLPTSTTRPGTLPGKSQQPNLTEHSSL